MMPPPQEAPSCDIFNLPEHGRLLIEANAGSGKTWQICTLYAWLVAVRGVPIEHIVVTTYTRLATQELRHRIRHRLAEFLLALEQAHDINIKDHGNEHILNGLENTLSINKDAALQLFTVSHAAKQRLEEALWRQDLIEVHTIHGFFLTLLQKHALSPKAVLRQQTLDDTPSLPLASTIIEEDDANVLWQRATHFAWRQAVWDDGFINRLFHNNGIALQPLPHRLLKKHIYQLWPSEKELLTQTQVFRKYPHLAWIMPQEVAFDWQQWQQLGELWSEKIIQKRPALIKNLEHGELSQVSYKPHHIHHYLETLARFFKVDGQKQVAALPDLLAEEHFKRLYASTLITKRLKKAAPQWRADVFFTELENTFTPLWPQWQAALDWLYAKILQEVWSIIYERFRRDCAAQRGFTFNEVIDKAHLLIVPSDADKSVHPIHQDFRAHTRVLLVDEFQDTDVLQWSIFKTLQGGTALSASIDADDKPLLMVMVGDPKQSIYQFRAADLYAYLRAKKEMTALMHLVSNHRATPPAVKAVNQFFAVPDAFGKDNIGYHPSKSARTQEPFYQASLQSLYQNFITSAPYALFVPPTGAEVLKGDDRKQWSFHTCLEHINKFIQVLAQEAMLSTQDIALQSAYKTPSLAILVDKNDDALTLHEMGRAYGLQSIIGSHNEQPLYLAAMIANFLEVLTRCHLQASTRDIRAHAKSLIWSPFLTVNIHDIINIAADKTSVNSSEEHHWLAIWQDFDHAKAPLFDTLFTPTAMRLKDYRARWLDAKRGHLGLVALWHSLMEDGLANRLIACGYNNGHIDFMRQLFYRISDYRVDSATELILLRAISEARMTCPVSHLRAPDDDMNPLESIKDSSWQKPIINILTIHKSKGQQYDFVWCPTAWALDAKTQGNQMRGLQPVYKDNQWSINISQSTQKADRDSYSQELSLEKIRLLYVMLTRATTACYVWWIPSAINAEGEVYRLWQPLEHYLMHKKNTHAEEDHVQPHDTYDAWRLEVVDINAPSNLHHNPHTAFLNKARDSSTQLSLADKATSGYTPHSWNGLRFTSYTALMRHIAYHLTPEPNSMVPLSNEAMDDINATDATTDKHLDTLLPRGQSFGITVHALMSEVVFCARPSQDNEPNKTQTLYENLQQFINAQSGYRFDKRQLDAIYQLIIATIETPLRSKAVGANAIDALTHAPTLAGLQPSQRISEWAFSLGWHRLNTTAWDACLNALAMPALSANMPSCGLLEGSLDLVFCHEGRYSLIDFKTNALDNYREAALETCMRQHGYYLQATIYQLALHRHLKRTLEHYNPTQHLGGVYYLFMRGLVPTHTPHDEQQGLVYLASDDLPWSLLDEALDFSLSASI